MHFMTTKRLFWVLILALVLAVPAVTASSEDLGNGFLHHGVATPVSNHRGTVATVDGAGKPVVLVWLFDHPGGYALLVIDAETGKAEQFPIPFPPGPGLPVRVDPLEPQQVLHALQQPLRRVRPGQAGLHVLREDRAADGHEHDRGRQGP